MESCGRNNPKVCIQIRAFPWEQIPCIGAGPAFGLGFGNEQSTQYLFVNDEATGSCNPDLCHPPSVSWNLRSSRSPTACGKVEDHSSLTLLLRAFPQCSHEQLHWWQQPRPFVVLRAIAPLGGPLNSYSTHKILMGFAKWIKSPYSFHAVRRGFWKTCVSRAVNLWEARGGSEGKSTDGEQGCHVCLSQNCKKPFWWAIV